jgi:hypothetical protein
MHSKETLGKASISRHFDAILQKRGIVYLNCCGQRSKGNKELRNVFFQCTSPSAGTAMHEMMSRDRSGAPSDDGKTNNDIFIQYYSRNTGSTINSTYSNI